MRQQYEFLEHHVPKNICQLTNSISEEITKTRHKIISYHRSVILSHILLDKNKEKYGEYLIENVKFPKFVFSPTEIFPPTVSPQLLQQSAHLFAFLHSRLSELFDGMMLLIKSTNISKINKQNFNHIDSPEFHYLISSAIPSLFGYFSSKEHVLLAFSFYFHALNLDSSFLAFKILYPFLTAPWIFRYFESSFLSFFKQMINDPQLRMTMESPKQFSLSKNNENENLPYLLETYSVILLNELLKNSFFLPSFFLTLVKTASSKWGHKTVGSFLFNELFRDMAFKFLTYYGYTEFEFILSSIFSYISETESIYISLSTNLSKVKSSSSSFDIPELFSSIGHLYMTFLISVPDLLALEKAITKKMQLPLYIGDIHTEFPKEKFDLFHFRLFPKRALMNPTTIRPLIFDHFKIEYEDNPDFERKFLEIQSQIDIPQLDSQYENASFKLNKYNQNNINEAIIQFKSVYEYAIAFNYNQDFIDYSLIRCLKDLDTNAENFEIFLSLMLAKSQINNWLSITIEHQRLMILPIANLAAKQAFLRSYETIDIAFEHASKLFKNSNMIQKQQFFSIFTYYLPSLFQNADLRRIAKNKVKQTISPIRKAIGRKSWGGKANISSDDVQSNDSNSESKDESSTPVSLKGKNPSPFSSPSLSSTPLKARYSSFSFYMSSNSSISDELESIENEWMMFLDQLLEQSDFSHIEIVQGKKLFDSSIEGFKNSTKNNLFVSYQNIVQSIIYVLALLDLGKTDTDLAQTVILLAKNKEMLSIYIILNEFAIKNNAFHSLCTETEDFAWTKFESTLLKMISSTEDKQLVSHLFEIQNSLINDDTKL